MSIATGLRSVAATRYVTALREGGSLPGLVEADDDGLYVAKFRGAGQGLRALVAEVIVGELARALGLLVPELVVIEIDPALGAAEPDPEIQELIIASAGIEPGRRLPAGRAALHAGGRWAPDPSLAADIVWLDALATNVDRTARNPNLLVWHGRLWLIDHGAALYLQHQGLNPAEHADVRFRRSPSMCCWVTPARSPPLTRRLAPRVDRALLQEVAGLVPERLVRRGSARDVRRLPGQARPQRGVRGGGRACPDRGVTRSHTRSCGSFRASSAASASTRGSYSSAGSAISWRQRWRSTTSA